MTDEEGFSNGVAKAAKEQVERTAARAARIQLAIAALFAFVGLIFIFVLIIGMLHLQDYAVVNRNLNLQNARILEQREQADAFGLKAVRCVLDQFALHRVTNQIVHDRMAGALRVDATPLSPLPPLPTDAQVEEDCGPFYQR